MDQAAMKKCFKCGEEKPRTEFYAHRMMADGLLGKCKICTRLDVKSHRRNPRYRESVLAYDRQRGNRQSPEYREAFKAKTQQEAKARTAVGNAVRSGRLKKPNRCQHCGSESPLHGHHHDYSKPLAVVWLCVPCHRQWHAMIDLIKQAGAMA